MKRSIVLTAYDRPRRLHETLQSLSQVRGLDRWDLYLSIDPHDDPVVTEAVLEVVDDFRDRHTPDTSRAFGSAVGLLLQERRLGVLRHPKHVFETLFGSGYDYVLRLEDDMLFTEDLLEYHEWASVQFEWDGIGFVESLSAKGAQNVGGPDEVERTEDFGSPLAIGTWPHVWREVLAPTWDSDYSTHNGTPGEQAGWDWNLTRVYPQYGLYGVRPLRDKVFHTGVFGAHSTPEIYELREPLVSVPEPIQYGVV
jgi:hypothetical protein